MSEMSQTLLFLCQVSTDWYSVYRATPPVTPQVLTIVEMLETSA